MAKLPDLIEQNQKKLKSTQQLAGEAGLPTPPITAVGTGTLGGTPQQQAMAGTPAQKKSVLEAVTKVARPGGETQLEQAKLLRAPAVETETDQASKARVQQLVQGLGTFGAKAVELIDSAKQSVFGAPAPTTATATTAPSASASGVQLVITADNLKDQPEAKRNKIQTLVSSIANETDPTKRTAAIKDLNIELGKSPDSPLSADDLDKFYAKVTETVAAQTEAKFRKAATGEDNVLTIEDFKNLGTSAEDLATLFNMAPADVLKMTVTDLQNKLAGLDVGTGEVQATTAGLSSGLLSTAERQALRGNLAQLEERGLAGAAVQYKSLLDDIDKGTTVSIGGTQYGIDELLADGAFADIAEQYFANPNSDWAKNLAKSEPGLVQWLTGNEKILNDLISSSKTSVTEFGKLQTARAEMFKGLDPRTVQQLTGIDLSQFATGKVDIASLPPAIQQLAKLPAGQRDTYGANLSKLTSVMGDQYVKGLDATKLAEMKLDDPAGPGAQWLTAVSTLRSNLQSPNRETRLDAVTDGTLDWDSVDDQLAEENFRIAMGYPPGELSKLDTNPKDGHLTEDELNTYIKDNAISALPTFEEFNSGTKQSIGKLKSPPTLTPAQQAVLDASKDGTISADEVAGLGIDQLQAATVGITDNKYKEQVGKIIEDNINKELNSAGIAAADMQLLDNPPQESVAGESPYAAAARWQDWIVQTRSIRDRLSALAKQDTVSKSAKGKISRLLDKIQSFERPGSTFV